MPASGGTPSPVACSTRPPRVSASPSSGTAVRGVLADVAELVAAVGSDWNRCEPDHLELQVAELVVWTRPQRVVLVNDGARRHRRTVGAPDVAAHDRTRITKERLQRHRDVRSDC